MAITIEEVKAVLDEIGSKLRTNNSRGIGQVNIKDGAVTVKILRVCEGCPVSQETIDLVKKNLRDSIPEIKDVSVV